MAIVGFAHTSIELAPYDDPMWEIWIMNEMGGSDRSRDKVRRWDRCFQLHGREDFQKPLNLNDPEHYAWLKRQTKPILMQRHYEDIPASQEYPLEEVLALVGRRYLTSTAAYALAYALLQGFGTIHIYGIEMGLDTDYVYQKGSFEWLLGMAYGLGVDIEVPENSQLLRGTLYAYETATMVPRSYIEATMKRDRNAYKAARDQMLVAAGQSRLAHSLAKDGKMSWEDAEKLLETEMEATSVTGNYRGRAEANEAWLNWVDGNRGPENEVPVPPSNPPSGDPGVGSVVQPSPVEQDGPGDVVPERDGPGPQDSKVRPPIPAP